MRSSSGRAPAADYNAKRNRIIDLQILEENVSKLQNYCYDEKNFKERCVHRNVKKMCLTVPILIFALVIPGILRGPAKISVRADHGHNQLYVCAPELSHCSLH